MKRKQTIKAKNCKHFCHSLNRPNLGMNFTDTRHKGDYDLGICSTSRGRCLVSWGLNLTKEELLSGVFYVYVGMVWDVSGKRENFELILRELK